MKSWISGSLKRKLSFLLVIGVTLPVLSLGCFAYLTSSSLSEQNAKMNGMNILHQLDTQLQLMVRDVENMSIFLIGDDDVQHYLRSPLGNVVLRTSITVFLTNLIFSKDYIANISIVPNDDKDLVSYSLNQYAYLPGAADLDQGGGEKNKAWSLLDAPGSKPIITFTRPVRSTNDYRNLGAVSISFNPDVIERNLHSSGMEGDGYVLLLDEQGRIIGGGEAAGRKQNVEELFPGLTFGGASSGFVNYGGAQEKLTLMYYKMPNVQWTLLGVIPFKQYSAENQYLLNLTAIVAVVAGLIIVALILFLIANVTEPLSRLARFMKDGNPEEEFPRLPVQSVDEVGQLVVSYNKLSGRIQRLTKSVKENEAMKKEADLQALQAQINPHFLYNTLSSVHWMALMKKEDLIAEMVGSLSDFLRFSLNRGEEYCPVRQEVAHADHYVRIQAIRYPGEFEVQFRVDPDCEGETMLKLLLQPLIENAILHGILKHERPGTILVTVSRGEGGLEMMVADNGAGINPDRLQRLEAALGMEGDSGEPPLDSGSYGLRNVHARLVMHYAGNSGLKLESVLGQGTKVSFIIPVQKEEEA